MAKALESRMLHFYGSRPENYLNDWARRSDHLADIDAYTVDVVVDSVGVPWGAIVRKQPVAETPTECHNHITDEPRPAPEIRKGSKSKKAADKSGDPFA
jgi:hypothetical protein